MGKSDMKPAPLAEADTLSGNPVIIAAIGRQRVGKTSFENALAQIVKERGGDVEVVNADTLNRSHNIGTFHPEATLSPGGSIEEQAIWMEHTLSRITYEGRDAIVDVGGGHTALHQVIEETPLAEMMEENGISLVVAYVLGPDIADIDYLDALMNDSKFQPKRSVIVLNEGLAPLGHDPLKAFAATVEHAVVREALAQGGHLARMPSLKPMGHIARSGAPYRELLATARTGRDISMFDMHRIRRWYETEFPEFLRSFPKGWLPRLPAGRTY